MPHLSDARMCSEGATTKGIKCINEHTLKKFNFSVLQILFYQNLIIKTTFEMFYFTWNESRIYESFTF